MDRSFKLPLGRSIDVPLNVGDFTYHVDFVIFEIEKDSNVPSYNLRKTFLRLSIHESIPINPSKETTHYS